MFQRAALMMLAAFCVQAQEKRVEPTFLRRFVPDLVEKASDLTTPTCHYKPIFGEGDSDARVLRGIIRFGEALLDPGGTSGQVNYPNEEQVYVITHGEGILLYGQEKVPLRKHDFVYLPPGVRHGIENTSSASCRWIVMGFRIPSGVQVPLPPKPLLANIDDVPKEVVAGHPPTTLYQLLMGDRQSKRDKLAAAHVLTSLFTMEFEPGGTNFPHHHEREEEIYLVLAGHGEMVAGGGMDGIEGRHPAKAGDAYFFRLNCTVGFYAGNKPGEEKSRILAVRSLFPFSSR